MFPGQDLKAVISPKIRDLFYPRKVLENEDLDGNSTHSYRGVISSRPPQQTDLKGHVCLQTCIYAHIYYYFYINHHYLHAVHDHGSNSNPLQPGSF
jgi:hypothetical protein